MIFKRTYMVKAADFLVFVISLSMQVDLQLLIHTSDFIVGIVKSVVDECFELLLKFAVLFS